MNIETIENPVDRFVAFVKEREEIRSRRSRGYIWPWTDNTILSTYSFTNIHREDDRVSKHYQKTIRDRYAEEDLVFPGTMLYRWFNREETCDFLFNQPDFNYQSTFERYMELNELEILLQRIRMTPTPHVTGSFSIPSLPGHPKGEGVMRYFHTWCQKPWREQWHKWIMVNPPPTLQEVYEWIKSNGLGTFMRGQIIADLKYLPFMCLAEDWWTFAAPGPGSKRGLNLVMRRDMDASWKPEEWLAALTNLNTVVTPKLEDVGIKKLHNQDLQNCLCEFSKFEKTRTGRGRPRRLYRVKEMSC